jgi:hypothetical protein
MRFKFNEDIDVITNNVMQPPDTALNNNNNFIAEQQALNPSEIKDTLKELNEDILDEYTNMSSIDMKTRLSSIEENSILIFDALVTLNMLPKVCLNITRQRKRLAISRDGKGRAEMIDAIKGGTQLKEKQNIFSRIKGLF